MIDPMRRWAAYGEKPDYAGLLTFGGLPYTEDPAELEGVDAAIVGAPMDELTSDAPGTRFGPRAIRAAGCASGPHLEAGVDAFSALRVVDFGDAPILPADPVRSHVAIQDTVAQVLAAGAIPIILGGDHSIAEPDIRACAEVHGPVGLVHFDTHTDTGARDVRRDALARQPDVPARRVRPRRPDALRADRPARLLARRRGVRLAAAARDRRPLHARRPRPRHPRRRRRRDRSRGSGPVFLSVDVDVLDPAFAPGTGTPEPGGMTSGDLLLACREIAAGLDIVGADVVEVIPQRVGTLDITALVADRTVREILTGIALRRGELGRRPLLEHAVDVHVDLLVVERDQPGDPQATPGRASGTHHARSGWTCRRRAPTTTRPALVGAMARSSRCRLEQVHADVDLRQVVAGRQAGLEQQRRLRRCRRR